MAAGAAERLNGHAVLARAPRQREAWDNPQLIRALMTRTAELQALLSEARAQGYYVRVTFALDDAHLEIYDPAEPGSAAIDKSRATRLLDTTIV